MNMGFDIISDLYLTPEESFNWENKATSLYCIVAGNVSTDTRTIYQTLGHLARFYQGIFYVPGPLEYRNSVNINIRTQELFNICKRIPKIAMLFQHVVILDGVAVLGCNGWSADPDQLPKLSAEEIDTARYEDILYMKKSIDKLQTHLEVKKIIVVSNSVPKKELFFGEVPNYYDDQIQLDFGLNADTESKIVNWVFGTYEKIVDTTIDSINYVNNPYYKVRPYWAKRINLTI
jgi:hypothetical protein